jgi:hypothetical protein
MADKDAPVSRDAGSKDTGTTDTGSKDTVSEDKERLAHLEEEIQAAEQHLRKTTHENEPHFYDEGGDGEGPVPG